MNKVEKLRRGDPSVEKEIDEIVLKYSPDQLRDNIGRWAAGGGEGEPAISRDSARQQAEIYSRATGNSAQALEMRGRAQAMEHHARVGLSREGARGLAQYYRTAPTGRVTDRYTGRVRKDPSSVVGHDGILVDRTAARGRAEAYAQIADKARPLKSWLD